MIISCNIKVKVEKDYPYGQENIFIIILMIDVQDETDK